MSFDTVKFDLLVPNKKSREMLLILFLIVPNGDWVSGTGMTFWLGGKWSSARIQKMSILDSQKWVEGKLMPREVGSRVLRWNYRLTNDAINTLNNVKRDSASSVITAHTPDMFELAKDEDNG